MEESLTRWPTWGIKYLVFSGGGAKGMAFVGTLAAIEEFTGVCSGGFSMQSIKGCIGTSICSIFALFAVCDMGSKEILQLILEDHILDDIEPDIDFNNLVREFGLDKGNRLKHIIHDILQSKFIDLLDVEAFESFTLGDLFERTRKALVCVCTDITNGKLAYLSYENYGDMPVWKAIVASMSIPLLFQPVCHGGAMFVDGVLLENLALSYYPIQESLIFRLSTSNASKPGLLEGGFYSYCKRLIECSLEWRETDAIKAAISPRDSSKDHIIEVNSGCIEALQFTITSKMQSEAIIQGIISTLNGLWRLQLSRKLQQR